MNLQAFILSDHSSRHRLRHLLFWFVFLLYFYFQSIHPQQFDDLSHSFTYRNALINVLCYAPTCMLVVYAFRFYLLSLVKAKSYLRSAGLFFAVYIGATAINSVAARVAFEFVTQPPNADKGLLRIIDAASWNARWALIVGIVAMGISLARDWFLQTRANMYMLKKNAQAEMRVQKSRIHPEWLFRALDKIKSAVSIQSSSSTLMILNLSDLLSYSLYESDDDLVPLEKELVELDHLVSLEKNQDETDFIIKLSKSGDAYNKYIAPMSVINTVVQYITDVLTVNCGPRHMHLHFVIRQHELILQSKLVCDNDRKDAVMQWPVYDSIRWEEDTIHHPNPNRS